MNSIMLKRHGAILSIVAASLGFAGCASTPAPVLLTLPAAVAAPVSSASTMVVPTDALPVLALARIDAPEYIVSRRVRYRTDGSTLSEWPDTYWAERIEVSLSREFAAAMRDRLPNWRMCDANCGELSPALNLRVVLNRMDYNRGERLLRANVRIILSTSDRLPRTLQDQERSYEIAAGADSAQAQARSYSDLLSRVATDASRLVALPIPARGPASGAIGK
jgi:uncharacterized lipoprotein YmbA